jgi:peptidyl-prolyl cis-trans isomerase A (cyclophilin A)
MRKLAIVLTLAISATAVFAQTAPAPAAKPAAKPAVTATAATSPKAIIDTTAGKITCTLFPDKAPLTVENFIGLATGTKDWTNPASHAPMHGKPLYDGTIFHRVIKDFMIQGGDPLGTGTGDPGYKFKDEYSDLTFDRPGRLAMANAGPNTNGSQFFITVANDSFLNNGHYTIFGQCENQDVAQKIVSAQTGPNDRPIDPTKIIHITIVKAGMAAAVPVKPKPATKP